jgi:hypothetical protein
MIFLQRWCIFHREAEEPGGRAGEATAAGGAVAAGLFVTVLATQFYT